LNFVHPQFLFALFAVSIPVVIHLFNFRRFKKVYFSDIRFLKEVKLQTQNRNRIKHLLVLLTRILAVSFLVLAFAQPFIPLNGKNSVAGMQSVSVFVDNSFSMENVSKNGMLLDEAKKIAREIALVHAQTDRFQLLTNEFEARHQRLVSMEEFLTMLDEVKESPVVKKVSEIVSRQNDILSQSGIKNRKSFIISDFQKSISDFENIKEDSTIKTILLPVQANQQNNLYIDSCWFETPVHQINQPEILRVRIKNISTTNLENIPLKLFLNNQQKAPSSFSIEPNGTKDIQLSFTVKEPGIQQGRIEIMDYPVTYDDKFYFSFNIEKHISVTCISAVSPFPSFAESNGMSRSEYSGINSLQSLFGSDSLFVLKTFDENKIDYASLFSQQLIVLSELKDISSGLAQELNHFVQNGGSLIVFPSAEADTASYKSFFISLGTNFYLKQDTADTKIDWVNFESEIFSDVFERPANATEKKEENLDLPVVHAHFTQSRSSHTNEEVLLRLKDGDPLFSKFTYKKGKVYISAVPLNPDWSNLARHAIFVPLMYKISMNSQPATYLFYTLGKNNSIDITSRRTEGRTRPNEETIFKIKGDDSSPVTKGFEVIPEHRIVGLQPTLFIHDQIKNAGNYSLFTVNEYLAGLSFNYDRRESDLQQFSPDELIASCERNGLTGFSLVDTGSRDISKVLADIGQGKKLWKWCLILALIFLAAETLLLRFGK